jgi:hypothetical protein
MTGKKVSTIPLTFQFFPSKQIAATLTFCSRESGMEPFPLTQDFKCLPPPQASCGGGSNGVMLSTSEKELQGLGAEKAFRETEEC